MRLAVPSPLFAVPYLQAIGDAHDGNVPTDVRGLSKAPWKDQPSLRIEVHAVTEGFSELRRERDPAFRVDLVVVLPEKLGHLRLPLLHSAPRLCHSHSTRSRCLNELQSCKKPWLRSEREERLARS
jgi:hypothetical protein